MSLTKLKKTTHKIIDGDNVEPYIDDDDSNNESDNEVSNVLIYNDLNIDNEERTDYIQNWLNIYDLKSLDNKSCVN